MGDEVGESEQEPLPIKGSTQRIFGVTHFKNKWEEAFFCQAHIL